MVLKSRVQSVVFRYVIPTRPGVIFFDDINRPGSFVSGLGLPLTALVAKNNIVTVITSICAFGGSQLNRSRIVRRLDRCGRLIRVACYDPRIHLCSHQVPWLPPSYQI